MTLTRGQVVQSGAAALAVALAFGGGAVVYGQAATPGTRASAPFGPWGGSATAATCPMAGAPTGAMMGGFGFGPGNGAAVSDAVLKQLGMTADQVVAQRRAGKSLAQLAQEKGVSRDALVATILDEHQAFLDAQVKAGRLAQARADAMQAMMQDRVGWMIDQAGPGPGPGPGAAGRGVGMMGRALRPTGIPGPWWGRQS